MPALAFVVPIVAGKEQTDREAMKRLTTEEQWDAVHRELGVTRHAVWHQETPNGSVAIVLLEGDDLPGALGAFASSEEPFFQKFRGIVQEFHGIDLAADPPPNVLSVIDSSF
jgi:hypothetical protein